MTKESEVTQVDRDAAAQWIEQEGDVSDPRHQETIDAMRRGRLDDGSLIQAFARHRLASQPATPAADVVEDWLTGDWFEKWQDATENASDDLLATLNVLRARVERTIIAALEQPNTRPDADLHPVFVEIMDEVEKATRKFPTWPTRIIDAGNVVSEEAGELAKACLQVTYEKDKETLAGVREEAIQTAAMAFRFVCSMDRYDCDPGPQHDQDPLNTKGGEDAD